VLFADDKPPIRTIFGLLNREPSALWSAMSLPCRYAGGHHRQLHQPGYRLAWLEKSNISALEIAEWLWK
jgi:hypothetical protein